MWQCRECQRRTRDPVKSRVARSACLGPGPGLAKAMEASLGHELFVASAGTGVAWLACKRCGSYAAYAPAGLAEGCPGHPTSRWKRQSQRAFFGRGLHPNTKQALRVLQPWDPGVCGEDRVEVLPQRGQGTGRERNREREPPKGEDRGGLEGGGQAASAKRRRLTGKQPPGG